MTAVVAVRIPDGADGDLATEAEQRLGRVEGVGAVTVDGLRGLDPQLSATIVTLTVAIESRVSADELREHLAATICIDTIERLAESH
ncbi:MAG: hypothetical protein ABEI77_02625 [Halorientalis sp.]